MKIIAIIVLFFVFTVGVSAFAETQQQQAPAPQQTPAPSAGKYYYFSPKGEILSCVVGTIQHALPACPSGVDLYKSPEKEILRHSEERRRIIEETTK